MNITAANHVIHLSRWWNPAVEDQCNDRCYRIGQNKNVTIHIPLATHPSLGDQSFDHVLDKLLKRKRVLMGQMMTPPVGAADLSDIFESAIS